MREQPIASLVSWVSLCKRTCAGSGRKGNGIAGRGTVGETATAQRQGTMLAALCCLTSPSVSRNSDLKYISNDSFFLQPSVIQYVWVSVYWNTRGILCLGKAPGLEQEIRREERQIGWWNLPEDRTIIAIQPTKCRLGISCFSHSFLSMSQPQPAPWSKHSWWAI